MLASSLLLLGSLACMASAHPIDAELEHQWPLLRQRRSPVAARTMILIRGQATNAGYRYARPERAYNPRAAMAAYTTGGTAATGSYFGAATNKQGCANCKQLVDEQPDAPAPGHEQPKSFEPSVPEDIPTEVEHRKGAVPERKPKVSKAPPKQHPVEEEGHEDDEEGVVTRKGGRRGGSVYKNFFPVTFGASSRGRLRAADDEEGAGEGGYGSVTAIANSFSKGRGAVASSSAVAYGHGHPGNSQQPRQKQVAKVPDC